MTGAISDHYGQERVTDNITVGVTIGLHVTNASAYRPLLAFGTQEVTGILEHDASFAVCSFLVVLFLVHCSWKSGEISVTVRSDKLAEKFTALPDDCTVTADYTCRDRVTCRRWRIGHHLMLVIDFLCFKRR